MKRALIVLLLLAVVAGGLFAQISWSGFFNSGFQVVIPNEGDTTFHWYSNDPGATYRLRVRAAYENEAGTVGASGALQSTAGGFGVDGGNAWIKLLDKQLHLNVGNGGIGGFGSMGGFDAGNTAADGRLSLAFTPALDGTTFSVGLGINPAGSNATNTFAKATYGFGLKFGLPGLLTAVANANYVPDTEVANAAAGIQIAALNAASGQSGLTNLAVDFIANNVTNDLAWVGIGPRVGFRVAGVGAGDLGATVFSRVFVPLNDDNDLDYWVGLDLNVPFTSAVDFNLNVGYEANAAIGAPNADTGILGASNREGTGRAIGGSGDAGLIVRPQLTFKFGAAAITTGWSVQALLASETVLQHAIYGYLNVGF
jgi:hypothetical protein